MHTTKEIKKKKNSSSINCILCPFCGDRWILTFLFSPLLSNNDFYNLKKKIYYFYKNVHYFTYQKLYIHSLNVCLISSAPLSHFSNIYMSNDFLFNSFLWYIFWYIFNFPYKIKAMIFKGYEFVIYSSPI